MQWDAHLSGHTYIPRLSKRNVCLTIEIVLQTLQPFIWSNLRVLRNKNFLVGQMGDRKADYKYELSLSELTKALLFVKFTFSPWTRHK